MKIISILLLFSFSVMAQLSLDGKSVSARQKKEYEELAKNNPDLAKQMAEQNSDFQQLSASEKEEALRQIEDAGKQKVEKKIETKIEKEDQTAEVFGTVKVVDKTTNEKRLASQSQDFEKEYRKIFGRDLFRTSQTLSAEVQATPGDYIIRSGDRIQLRFWGQLNSDRNVMVKPDGYVFIDAFNRQEYVKGMSYSGLKSLINRSLEGMVGVEGDVTVIPSSVTRVRISGAARKPGAINVPVNATFWQVLMNSGGPDNYGSVREIKLIRKGRVIYTMDLYQYLLNGHYKEVTLRDGDEIQFASVKKVVKVGDVVKRAGLYELKKKETFADLLKYCGGLEAEDFVPVLRIERIIPVEERNVDKETRRIIEIAFSDKKLKSTVLLDGDYLDAIRTKARFNNKVEIKGGGVKTPGVYSLPETEQNIWTVIEKAGGFKEGYFEFVEVIRKNAEGTKVFNLDASEQVFKSFSLQSDDLIITYAKKEFRDLGTIKVSGFVNEEKMIPYEDSLNLAVVLQRTRGLKYGATPYAYVRRENENGEVSWKKESLDEKLVQEVSVEPRTQVYIFNNKSFNLKAPVSVFYPDKEVLVFDYSESLNLDVIIHRLGGLSPFIDKENLEVNYLDESLDAFFQKELVAITEKNLVNSQIIQPGMVIHFRENPRMSKPVVISVSGEVNGPGSYTILKQKESVKSMLEKAGGLTSRGNPFGVKIYRKGVEGSIPVPIDSEDDVFASKMLLAAGDRLHVMRDDRSVEIRGSVLSPGFVPFDENWTWEDYVNNGAGGALDTADIDKTLIIYPNGVSKKAEGGCFAFDKPVVSGSVIIVPEKPYVPPQPPEEGMNVAEFIQATTAGITSVLMVMLLYMQVKNE
jgi:protein involved in polysaccharide export with SLBB domain